MIDGNAPFKSPPRIARATFTRVLTDVGSPWAAIAPTLYDLIVWQKHDPAVWLAIAGRETTFGTNLDSVFGRNDTHSWTNARTVRLTSLMRVAWKDAQGHVQPVVSGTYQIITDPVRKSQYVRYFDVIDSLLDGMYRVDEPGYAYQQAHAVSIAQVLAIWTEAESAEYTAYVVAKINEWSAAMAGDDPRFQWTPDTDEFGYPQRTHGRNGQPIELLILHITAGTDSQAWLLGGHGSSTHYLTHTDGTPRAQHVADADAAWTPGSRDYALRSLNLEVEMLKETDWTDAIMREVARTAAPIMQRHNIPAVYLGRDNGPGKRGMIGHRDVPDPNKPGQWGGSSNHTDPGANFDWGKFAPMVAAEMAGGVIIPPDSPPQNEWTPEGNPYGTFTFRFGFYGYVQRIGAAIFPDDWQHGALSHFGYPMSDEFAVSGGSVQPCERYVLRYQSGVEPPWDIVGLLRTESVPEAA